MTLKKTWTADRSQIRINEINDLKDINVLNEYNCERGTVNLEPLSKEKNIRPRGRMGNDRKTEIPAVGKNL